MLLKQLQQEDLGFNVPVENQMIYWRRSQMIKHLDPQNFSKLCFSTAETYALYNEVQICIFLNTCEADSW